MYFKHKYWWLIAAGFLVLLPFRIPGETAGSSTNNNVGVVEPAEATDTLSREKDDNAGDGESNNSNIRALRSQPVKKIPQESKTIVLKTPTPTAEPVSLLIHPIGLRAPLIRTGLEPDGSLHVPGNPQQSGWYTGGPKPGEIGPSVITGHYDSVAGPGIFYNLNKVKIGEEVRVVQNDGVELVFKIEKKGLYPQDDFPTQLVYGPISNAGLRIITCAGTYNRVTRHYSHDLVVYASLTRVETSQSFQPR